MRRLTSDVVAGGVVYPAGTGVDDVPEKVAANAALWTDDETAEVPSETPEQESGDGSAERQAALTAEVERLTAEVERLQAENDALREQGASPVTEADTQSHEGPEGQPGEPEPPQPTEDYSEYGVKELKAEIALRNKDRESPVEVAEPGNKPELIAALIADDQAQA